MRNKLNIQLNNILLKELKKRSLNIKELEAGEHRF